RNGEAGISDDRHLAMREGHSVEAARGIERRKARSMVMFARRSCKIDELHGAHIGALDLHRLLVQLLKPADNPDNLEEYEAGDEKIRERCPPACDCHIEADPEHACDEKIVALIERLAG